MIANLPRFMKRNRTAPIHFSPRDDIGDAHGRAGRRDVGPYHAPRHVRTRTSRAAHARHVRTRTPCAHLVGRDVLGAPRPRNAHGTTSGTPTGTRAAGDVGPYHVPHHTPMVGRDVLGAPLPTERPRDAIGDAHGYAGRRGRRPLPRSTPHPHGRARRPRRAVAHENAIADAHGARGPPGTSAPTTHRATSTHARHIRTRTSRAAHARHARTW